MNNPLEKTNFIIVYKNAVMTRFMQSADLFEPFKFIGETLEASGRFTLPVDQVLVKMSALKYEDKQIVGLIVPNNMSVFFENHKVISTDGKWARIEDLCALQDAPVTFIPEPF